MLKQLKLKKEIELKKREREAILAKEKELETREADLEKSLEEAENQSDLDLVNEAANELEKEKQDNKESKSKIEKEIEDLEKELKDTEDKAEDVKTKDEEEKEEEKRDNKEFERGTENMRKGSKYVNKLTREQRKEYVKRENVKKFLDNVRIAVKQRSITGLEMTIPEEMMELITDNIGNYSVFYNLVNLRPTGGKARANIIAEAVEAVWTEQKGMINEISESLSQVEVDGYKVAGYVGVDNYVEEDSDVDLSVLIEDLLSESIAIAIDKAVPYGKGKDSHMPTGYVTALNADDTLKVSNIKTLSQANTKLENIIAEFKNIERGVSNRGKITVVMNEKTWLGTILPKTLATNSAGAYVSASQGVFPATGYDVEFCNQIPENEIHAGDFTKYLLAERKGKKFSTSAEAEFVKDITLFKATARYDGIPSRKGAFVVIGINGTTPQVEATFAPDTANAEPEEEEGGEG
ncbi:MAG: phage major capsid protein [Clostridia bacterium]|nr:phage major capsid protein [Clostridia bacterium]